MEVVFTTLSETSTGVVNDVRELTEVAHRHGALIAVDAVSGLGAVPLPQDEWGVDVVVAGLAEGADVARRASASPAPTRPRWPAPPSAPRRGYYFDWLRTADGQRKDPPDCPFTPAVGLWMALDVALGLIEEEGLEQVFERHRLLGRATRAAVRRSSSTCSAPRTRAPTWSRRSRCRTSIDGAKVPKLMRDRYGITIAGGQGKLKGKIARIAHCGYFGAFDIVITISAFEMTLRELGDEVELGAGVAAAQRVFLEAGVPVAAPRVTKVLVAEKIGDSRRRASCATPASTSSSGPTGPTASSSERIGEFDGILIRSATKLDADLLRARGQPAGRRPGRGGRRQRRRRRGHEAGHRRRQRAAVERHHRRRAHDGAAARARAQRAAGARLAHRGRLGPLEVQRRGALREDARHPRLRPHRPARGAAGAAASACACSPSTPTSPRSASPSSASSGRASSDELYAAADFITLHLPKTPETENWLDAEAFAKMKDGVRILNVARGPLLVDDDLKAALDSGKVAGAALDVFREEPITEHPLFGYPNVIVTPHLGASTAEATDRAGYQAAEQVVAALTGGVVTSAVNVPAVAPEDMEALGPFLPLAAAARPDRRRRWRTASVDGSRSSTWAGSPSATRACSTVQVLKGVLAGHTEEDVNDVNAPVARRGARDRGGRDQPARGARLHRPGPRDRRQRRRPSTRVVGTVLGRGTARTCSRRGARASTSSSRTTWRSSATRTSPGCSAASAPRSATAGVNIVSAAVGRRPEDEDGEAAMVVTADAAIPQARGRRDRRRRRLRRRARGSDAAFRAAVEAGDIDAALALVHRGRHARQPGRVQALRLDRARSVVLRAVFETFEYFHYTDEFEVGRHARAALPAQRLLQVRSGLDLIRMDDSGRSPPDRDRSPALRPVALAEALSPVATCQVATVGSAP